MDGALHGTPLPNGTRLDDSWATIVPKSKLVLALGWFHQQWLANQTRSKWPWSGPYELGRRISFCQAVHLYQSLGSPQRLFDAPSSTWFFDCHHDAANESTFEGCGPWPDARAPVTTQICAPLFAAPCARLCYGRAAVSRHNTHSAVAVLRVRIPATDLYE